MSILASAQARSKPLLYAPRVKPEPNVFTEARVNPILQAFDPHFFLSWIPTAVYSERHRDYEGRYAVCQRWVAEDPRWKEVQEGRVPADEAFDLWCWWTIDKQKADAPPPESEGEMLNVLLDYIGKADNTRFPWRQRIAATTAHNAKQRELVRAPIVEQAGDEAETQFYLTGQGTRVFSKGLGDSAPTPLISLSKEA